MKNKILILSFWYFIKYFSWGRLKILYCITLCFQKNYYVNEAENYIFLIEKQRNFKTLPIASKL